MISITEIPCDPPLFGLRIEGELSATDHGRLAEALASSQSRGPRAVVLDVSRLHSIDALELQWLRGAVDDDLDLRFCGCGRFLRAQLESVGLGDCVVAGIAGAAAGGTEKLNPES